MDILRRAHNLKKTFHIEFDATEQHQILSGRFFQILCPSQNVQTLRRCPLRTQTVSILNLTWYPLATLASQKDLPIGVFQQSTGGTSMWQLCVTMMSWVCLFTNRLSATRKMKVKTMGTTEILRRIWLFSTNKIESFKSVSKQPSQLIVELNSS